MSADAGRLPKLRLSRETVRKLYAAAPMPVGPNGWTVVNSCFCPSLVLDCSVSD